jgi:ElaB/YqjD/DUF883 family membrane-anchored ribosome-binding protein
MSDENFSQSNTQANKEEHPETKGNFDDAKAHARQAAEQFRAAAGTKAREFKETAGAKAREFRDTASAKAGEFRDRAGQYYDEARGRAKSWQEEGEIYVRENPLKAVVTAVAAGFLVGLLIRKS